MKRILILGAGGAPSTNFIRSLKKKKKSYYIVGTDANPYYLCRSETEKNYLVPFVSDPGFLPKLQDIIKKESIDYLHIQNDKEVGFISEHRNEIPTALFLPSRETVRICQDKYESFIRWEKAGLQVPKTIPIQTPQDLKNALQTFKGSAWILFQERSVTKTPSLYPKIS